MGVAHGGVVDLPVAASHRLLRGAVVVAVVAALAALMLASDAVRHVEASVASLAVGVLAPAGVSGPVVVVGLDGGAHLGLRITAECSVSMLFVPSLVALAGLMLVRSTDPPRLLEASVVALLLIAAVNLARIVAIAAAAIAWGEQGYWVLHVVVGSLVSIGAVLGGLLVQVRWGLASARRATRMY